MNASNEDILFKDRHEAGRMLGAELIRCRDEAPIVLGAPRGGVVIGYEIARALNAPLDVLPVRKIGVPGRPELGVGAVAPGGVRVVDDLVLSRYPIDTEQMERLAAAEEQEMRRREQHYRGGKPPLALENRMVILADDGLATGVTIRAAVMSVRRRAPRRLIVAAPVCAYEAAEALRPHVDELICLHIPTDFYAVGFWYHEFEQVSDEEVVELLRKAG